MLITSLRESFSKFNDPRKWDKDALSQASTFEDALYVQTVLDAIRKSSKSSDWEKVKFLCPSSKSEVMNMRPAGLFWPTKEFCMVRKAFGQDHGEVEGSLTRFCSCSIKSWWRDCGVR